MRRLALCSALAALFACSMAQAQPPGDVERHELLKACDKVPSRYQAACARAVNEGRVALNTLRICALVIDAKVAMYQRKMPSVEQLRALPHAGTCASGLRRAGFTISGN